MPPSHPYRREDRLLALDALQLEGAEIADLGLDESSLKCARDEKPLVQCAAEACDPGGEIHLAPDHGVVEPRARADIAVGGVTEMERDPDLEVHAVAGGVPLVDRFESGARRSQCAPAGLDVVVCAGAEDCQDSVADEF